MTQLKEDIKKTRVIRAVSQEEFEAAIEQWKPKMVKFATNTIPFLDWDDKIQEAQLVLYKCLQRFETGHGAIFHTYFHRALFNRAGVLAHRPLKHNENPMKTTYLGEMENAADEDGRGFSKLNLAIGEAFDPSMEFEIESWGFTGMEIPYMIGVVINHITLKETAALFGLDIKDLEAAKEAAKQKMNDLREVSTWADR